MSTEDCLAALMAEQADAARDVEARELLAAVRRRMFARASAGLRLGRYQGLERIGAGGMGIVYSAHDPSLDRPVALKVLRASLVSDDAHLLREARALARVAHPNIVAVLDVGIDGDDAFIAMELVRGQTLAAWLARARPSVARVVDVLADVGRGVAAAHERGLVHRDLKPSNVLIGEDGRVRVTDFGLAAWRAAGDTERSGGEPRGEGQGSTTLHGGTLGYAAPEQLTHGAGAVDARADQFALGVCLYEALTGERPFPAPTVAAFVAAARAGPPDPRRAGVPRPLARVLARALAPAPEQRYADMLALVDAMTRAVRPRRWRPALVACLGAGALAIAWGTLGWRTLEPDDARCPAGPEVDAQWGDAPREQARAAFLATGLPYASASFDAVDGRLDAAIDQWVAEYERACRAGPVDAHDERFDARLACLEEQRAGLEALAALLHRADATTVEHAVESVSSLPSATACREPPARGRAAELSAPDRRLQAELSRRCAAARALVAAGAYDEAARALADAPAGIDEALHASGLAELAMMRGRVDALRGRLGPAHEHLGAAYHLATIADDERLVALTAGELAEVVGVGLSLADEGAQWQRHAEAALARWGDRGAERASVHAALAAVLRARGDLDGAMQHLEQARALLEAADTPHDHDLASVLTTTGAVLHDAGRYRESLPVLERALALLERSLGDRHPRLVATLVDLGVTHQELGDLDAATRVLTRALEVARATLGPEHLETAAVDNDLGNVAVARGADDEARAHFEHALAIYSAQLGPEHPKSVMPLVNLGSIHARAGRHAQARARFESALEALRASKGPDDPSVAQLLVNLAHLEQERGETDQARAHYEEALVIFERRLGPSHPHVAVVLVNLGMLALESADHDRACEQLQRAVEIREAALGPEHPAVAYALVAHGQALAAAGRAGEAAARLRRAIALHRANGEDASVVAEAQHVLAELEP